MATTDLKQEIPAFQLKGEIPAFHEEKRELEASIRRHENVKHSTSRPHEIEICENYNSGIESVLLLSIIPESPLTDHFAAVEPDGQSNLTHAKVRFNEELDNRDKTNTNDT